LFLIATGTRGDNAPPASFATTHGR
jgi:hypothetical protein